MTWEQVSDIVSVYERNNPNRRVCRVMVPNEPETTLFYGVYGNAVVVKDDAYAIQWNDGEIELID